LTKAIKLKNLLGRYKGVVVAFSGGVDSTLLLKTAKDILKNNVIAVTAASPIFPRDETLSAKRIARGLKCRHIIVRSDELRDSRFIHNPRNRCYYCKIGLFKALKKIARKYDYAVIEASNKSDLQDYRPGLIAAWKLGVKSPLIEAGFDKAEIRKRARQLGLANWNKPSMACLASRIPYGVKISVKVLERIELAEKYLKKQKLSQVRVRDHYPIARIEVLKKDIKNVLDNRQKIAKYFKRLGYKYTALDLEGYKTGSLNR
jgi:uncharacterized protein